MLKISERADASARFAIAGLALAAVELALVRSAPEGCALSTGELFRYTAAAWASLTAVCEIAGAAGLLMIFAARRARPADAGSALGWAAGALGAPAIFLDLWLLTGGRRASAIPGRALLVTLLTAPVALAAAYMARGLYELASSGDSRRRAQAGLGLAALSAAALTTDAYLLRRVYPAFHAALACVSIISMLCASAVWPVPKLIPPRAWLGAAVAGVFLTAISPAAFYWLAEAPKARTAAMESAPLSGKLMKAALRWAPSRPAIKVARSEPPAPLPEMGIDLRGKDVMLITIDALRADRLSAYGGRGLTPNLDALARESSVFLRAYTSSPNTFYGLGSLLTGEFLRSAAALNRAASHRATLPELLKRYGYRTAAFFPPAVLDQDGKELAKLAENNFGFEYCRKGYASAPQRVGEVKEFLDRQPAASRVFIWVHLFEPHEPYQPPERFTYGRTEVERYDGEVAAADEAAGELARDFRSRRPDATVILTADHGEEFGDHGGYYHGTTLYDEQARVPLLWSSPGSARPRMVARAVDTVDIATTLLSALGIPRDPRMQGDDLGAALRGADSAQKSYAFSEIEEIRMACDGRFKAICAMGESDCRLYDLSTDPTERNNLAEEKPELAALFREALAEHIGKIARLEAGSDNAGRDWPEALNRARLGDALAGVELVPLLGSERAAVRAAAARWCGELGYRPAIPALSRLREQDRERAGDEAAIACLWLGDRTAQPRVLKILKQTEKKTDSGELDLARRAALASAAVETAAGGGVLIDLARDRTADMRYRKRAVEALGALRDRRAVKPLCDLLGDAYLRTEAARALGEIGDRRAADALARALSSEPYLPSREAEARALIKLRDPRARALLLRLLETDRDVPGGVELLQSMARRNRQ